MRCLAAVALAAVTFFGAETENAVAASQVCVAWHADVIDEPEELPNGAQVPSKTGCTLRNPGSAVSVVASGDWQVLIWLGGECGIEFPDVTLSSSDGESNGPIGVATFLPNAIAKGACAEGRVFSPGSTILATEMPLPEI